ncbi:MAG: DUF167 domain-containing protein [Candidatus Taylorbacteria bacterium]|nr:DUF167 domain-containing protein [Candidatus Taylorbacteria bacterium]
MYIKVEVIAGAGKESIEELSPTSFFVSVREEARNNQANRRVLELIRHAFGTEGVRVKIVSGHHSPRKIISVEVKNSVS